MDIFTLDILLNFSQNSYRYLRGLPLRSPMVKRRAKGGDYK